MPGSTLLYPKLTIPSLQQEGWPASRFPEGDEGGLKLHTLVGRAVVVLSGDYLVFSTARVWDSYTTA